MYKCIWKITSEYERLNNPDCQICDGYNVLCKFYYPSRQNKTQEDTARRSCVTMTAKVVSDCDKTADTHSHGGRLSLDRKSSLHRHHDTSKTVDLISMIRNDASGVWNE